MGQTALAEVPELAGMPERAELALSTYDGRTMVSCGCSLLYRYDADDTGMRNLAIVALTDAGQRIDAVAGELDEEGAAWSCATAMPRLERSPPLWAGSRSWRRGSTTRRVDPDGRTVLTRVPETNAAPTYEPRPMKLVRGGGRRTATSRSCQITLHPIVDLTDQTAVQWFRLSSTQQPCVLQFA